MARPATDITVADIIRAVEGPLAAVRGVQPQELGREDTVFQRMWVSVRASLRSVLEHVTVADLAVGHVGPGRGQALADDEDAWSRR